MVLLGLLSGAVVAPGSASAAKAAPTAAKTAAADFGAAAADSPDLALDGWGDAAGYHVELGRESAGFAWREVALLRPAGRDESSWTGYQCLSGDGRFAAVAILPASAVNQQAARDHGAFAYSVDLASGAVRPLASGVGLKYFSPGCGVGAQAVFSLYSGENDENTQVLSTDLATGAVVLSATVPGQFTSAVPTADGVVGVMGTNLVSLSGKGNPAIVATLRGNAYDVRPTADGGVGLLQAATGSRTATAYAEHGGKLTKLGSGEAKRLHLFQGRAGRAVLSGATSVDDRALTTAGVVGVKDRGLVRGATASSLDGDALTGADSDGGKVEPAVLATKSGKVLGRSRPTSAGTASTAIPEFVATATARTAASVPPGKPNAKGDTAPDTVAAAAQTPVCAVPRLNPAKQAMQPNAAQVNWAIQMAEQGLLVGPAYTRPAGFANLGLAAYAPNENFPMTPLSHPAGDSWNTVPRSIYEAIVAQESNFSQASWHSPAGTAGAPLVADYYGASGDIKSIDYAGSDCGYGLGQITTGMHVGDGVFSVNGQTKIAVDYQENVSAGLQILEDTWNQLYAAGITANGGSPRYLENWYFAAWAYNSGIQPNAKNGNTTGCTPGPTCTGPDGTWGLGWANNPANPDYPPTRDPYLQDTYADAAHPGSWPYQERVLGWTASPLLRYAAKAYAKPDYHGGNTWVRPAPFASMCVPAQNHCDPNGINPNAPDAGHCMLTSFQCWWHQTTTWIPDCATTCTTSAYEVGTGTVEPANPSKNPPTCDLDTAKVPANAIIVDDEPSRLNLQGCGSSNWSSNGTFAYSYGTNAAGDPIGAIDTHQLGTGLGGHVLFSHTEDGTNPDLINTGTWTPNLPSLQYYKIKLHIPGLGAQATNVVYTINPGGGVAPWKIRVNQAWNSEQWVTIGTFAMQNGGTVVLTNNGSSVDNGGFGFSDFDVAYDAIAFVPQGGTPGQPIGGPPGVQDAPNGSNPSWVQCGCAARTAGDPVNTATGYFDDSFADLATPGRGMALDFTRSYAESVADPHGPNGSSAANGPFGWGWTFSYNLSTSVDGAGAVTVHQENGSQVAFLPAGGGYAPAAPRFDAALAKVGSTYVFTRRGKEVFTFDAATGRLASEADLPGQKAVPAYRTALAYDTDGHLKTITDPAGRTYTLSWTGSHITGLADQAGRQVTYGYDGEDNLTDVYGVGTTRTPTRKDDDHFRYWYALGTHLMTSMRTPANFSGPASAQTSMTYDSAERVRTQTDANGLATTFAYGPDSGLAAGQTLVTDPAGHRTLHTYQNGLLVSETKGYGTADAGTASYTYDPVTLGISTQTDPDGRVRTFTYDDHGNQTSASNPLGFTTNYAYDDHGHLLEAIDANGVATVSAYDQPGHIPSGANGILQLTSTTVTKANNVVESTTGNFGPEPARTENYYYDDAAHPADRTRTTDPNGKTTTSVYDGFGDRTSVTDPLGHRSLSGYDTATGRRTSAVDANGSAAGVTAGCVPPAKGCSTFGYDSHGRITTTKDALNHTTLAEFDADGDKTSVTDANNHKVISTFDPAGRLVKVTQADGTTQLTHYNPDDTVADVIDGLGAKTAYGYDGQGRKTTRTDADNRTTTSHLDPAGLVLTATDPAGRVTTVGYDSAGQTKSASYSDGATPATAFGYDPSGRRVSMTDGTGSSTWTYNTFGELTSQKQGSGALVAYDYDSAGNQTSITYPGRTTPVLRAFDDAERLKSVTDWNGAKTVFGYDDNGAVKTTAYPNGTTITNGYNDNAKLTSTTAVTGATTVLSATYGRDPIGQLSGQTIAGTSQTFGYTAREQLASDGATSYVHDPADNPTTVGAATQAFDPAGQLCWALPSGATANPSCGTVPAGAVRYAFDDLGQRKSAGATTYGYDQTGKLATVTGTGVAATYRYDGTGLRASKTVTGSVTTFVWDSGSTPNILTDGTNSYVYGPEGLPVEQSSPAGVLWFVHDQIGSTIALLNSTGAVVCRTTYTPYGVATTTGTARTPLGYTGQYTDAETGFVQLRARYYDPATAVFLTVDPKVDSTHSAYGYVAGNPLNGTDLGGLCWSGFGWACSAASAVGGAVATAANWTWENRGWIEVGLAVASIALPMISGPVWIASLGVGAFWAGTALTAADTANACWNGQGSSCGLGVLSLATGGAGVAFGRASETAALDASRSTGFAHGLDTMAANVAKAGMWVGNISSLGATVGGACGMNIIRDRNAPDPFTHGR